MTTPNLNFPTSAFETIESTIRLAPRGTIDFARLVPINVVSEATESIAQIEVDYTGKSSLITGESGESLNLIGFTANKTDIGIMDIGHAIQFNDKDIRTANAGNVNNMTIKTEAANKIGEQALYDIAMTGTIGGVTGLVGLTNLPTGTGKNDVSFIVVPKKWSADTITAQNIADDLLNGFNLAWSQTKGMLPPNRLVLPLQAFTIANAKRLDGGLGLSAMALFRQSLRESGISDLTVIAEDSFKSTMLFYSATPDVLRMNVAHGFRAGRPVDTLSGFAVAWKARVSGLQVLDYAAFGRVNNIL